MAKSKKLERKPNSQHHGISLRKFSSRFMKGCGDSAHHQKKVSKEWEDAVCSVCLEFPHNAVLLLCSAYDKGCRPYMCATSHRYSNCLDQYKKAYTKVTSNQTTQSWQRSTVDFNFSEEPNGTDGKSNLPEILCPLCRGQVKGWTLVEPARRYLNMKKRTCMQDNCSFHGNYKQLRKHVKFQHPLARPRDVDPSRAEKWKNLETERDLSDVLSTIRSTMPGAIVIGDYVIERNSHGDYDGDDYWEDPSFRFSTHDRQWNGRISSPDSFEGDYNSLDDEEFRRRVQPRPRSAGSAFSSDRQLGGSRVRPLTARRVGRIGWLRALNR